MLALLNSYSLSEIIIFIIILCLAIKEVVTFYDWGKTRIQEGYNKNLRAKTEKDNTQEQIDTLNERYQKQDKDFKKHREEIQSNFTRMNDQIDSLTNKIEMLIKSDKDDIKSYIVEKHHFFCYGQKWIDDYNLDCLERRYSHYVEEKGNSYVEDLMAEIRALPKQPPQE
jgi:flagellar biosynthesis GTPase FlhF